MHDDDLGAEYEALLQFVYMAPIGIVQFGNDGTVAMMNPNAAQLLMTISPAGDLANVLAALDPVAPGVRELVAGSEPDAGQLCQDMRVELPPAGARDRDGTVLSVSLIRLDRTRLMLLLGDVSDVARRERAMREKDAWHKQSLELALEAAQSANRAKSEFLANISHELRTPMHAISSFAKLGHGRSGAAPREKLQRYFQNIEGSADRLSTLLNDLLDLAKIEAGRMRYDFAPQDLAETLGEVMVEFDALATDRGVRLALDVRTAETRIRGDAARLKQVFVNLLSNAIKFSPEGGAVAVSVESASDDSGARRLLVTVADEGPGIPPDELEAVFDKFVQSSKTKTGAGGTGLGLPIAREIVNAHDGVVRAENREPRGARFVVDLPVDAAAPAGNASEQAAA